jgi:hypothetical protein
MTGQIQLFDLVANVTQALLWQYNEALRLQSLVEDKQDWYNENQTAFWNDWHTDVFDLRTANEFGCAVWSIILLMPLTIPVSPDSPGIDAWGFDEYRKNFNNGNFTDGQGNFITLTIEQKRMLLRLRYRQLTAKGTVPEANAFAREIFGPGVYVLDGLDMTAQYVFTTEPSSSVKFILKYFDVLPRPAGVGVTYETIPAESFGFEQYRVNFDNAPFANRE